MSRAHGLRQQEYGTSCTALNSRPVPLASLVTAVLVNPFDLTTDIWNEFYHSGPDGKPCVVQLMAKYGMEKWFYRSTTPEGNNNRKNIWNRRCAELNLPFCYCYSLYVREVAHTGR